MPSNLSKTGILNFGGSLTYRKREREREQLIIHKFVRPPWPLDHFFHLVHVFIDPLFIFRDGGVLISLAP